MARLPFPIFTVVAREFSDQLSGLSKQRFTLRVEGTDEVIDSGYPIAVLLDKNIPSSEIHVRNKYDELIGGIFNLGGRECT